MSETIISRREAVSEPAVPVRLRGAELRRALVASSAFDFGRLRRPGIGLRPGERIADGRILYSGRGSLIQYGSRRRRRR
jgi:hypothetical protein